MVESAVVELCSYHSEGLPPGRRTFSPPPHTGTRQSMMGFAAVLSAATLMALVCLPADAASRQDVKPHVVVVLADDLVGDLYAAFTCLLRRCSC